MIGHDRNSSMSIHYLIEYDSSIQTHIDNEQDNQN